MPVATPQCGLAQQPPAACKHMRWKHARAVRAVLCCAHLAQAVLALGVAWQLAHKCVVHIELLQACVCCVAGVRV